MSLKETISKALAPSLKKIGVDIKELYKKIEDVSKNAFNQLTEEQKQTLKGPKGEAGPQGPPGPKGEAGPQGPAGADATNLKLSIDQNRGTLSIGSTGTNEVRLPGAKTFEWKTPNGTAWFKNGSIIKLLRRGQFVFAYLEGPSWGAVNLFRDGSNEARNFPKDNRTIDGKNMTWYRIKLPNGNNGFQGHSIIPYGFRPTSDINGIVVGDSGTIVATILFGSGANENCIRFHYEGQNTATHIIELLRLSPVVWITTDNEPNEMNSPTNGTIRII